MGALKTGSRKAMGNTIIPKLFFSVFIFIILFHISLSNVMSIHVLRSGFSRYGVYEIFSMEEANDRAMDILDFFDSKSDFTYFDDNERSHLSDVKYLLDKFQMIYLFSILILFFWILLDRSVLSYFKFSGFFVLVILSFFTALVFLNFDMVFQRFHEIFFNGNYSFDPRISEMKALFPDAFFMYLSFIILLKLLGKSLLLCVFNYKNL